MNTMMMKINMIMKIEEPKQAAKVAEAAPVKDEYEYETFLIVMQIL
jgi:hypothetical protein